MQLHQIEYFLAVAETLSFTKGAEQSNVVQSAISAAVRQLERDLGTELFERRARSISLTAAGLALLPRAREILGAVHRARDAVDSVRGTVQGTIVLGTLAHLGSVDLAGILQRLHRDYPDVVVKLRQTILGTRTSLEQLRSGALDLALVSAGAGQLAGIDLHPLHTEPLLFVCPGGHRLAGRTEVSLAETAPESFIDFPDGWGNRTSVEGAFAAAGLTRAINTEVVSFTMALELVQRNLGVAFLPESAVQGADGVSACSITDANLSWRIQLARSTARTPPTAETVLIQALTGTVPPA
jgi:DNA-binding transcriptional LysR family regulator